MEITSELMERAVASFRETVGVHLTDDRIEMIITEYNSRRQQNKNVKSYRHPFAVTVDEKSGQIQFTVNDVFTAKDEKSTTRGIPIKVDPHPELDFEKDQVGRNLEGRSEGDSDLANTDDGPSDEPEPDLDEPDEDGGEGEPADYE